MISKISKMSDNDNYKNNQVIGNRDVAELWNRYKNFKAKFQAHHSKLEQLTLKLLNLSFFSNSKINKKKCNNQLTRKFFKNRKIKKMSMSEFALIKRAVTVHLRSLQVEQRLYEENQYLKELLNNSYKIVIKEKNSPVIEMYEMKNVGSEEKSFKTGVDCILRILDDVSNKTKLKIKNILGTGISPEILQSDDSCSVRRINYINGRAVTENLECHKNLPHESAILRNRNTGEKVIVTLVTSQHMDPIKIEAEKFEKFNLKIDVPSNPHFDITNISEMMKNYSTQSLDSLGFDAKPVHIEAEGTQVASAKVRSIEKEINFVGIDIQEQADVVMRLKNIRTLMPNNRVILNYMKLFFPLSILVKKSVCHRDAKAKKKSDKLMDKDEGVPLENVNSTFTAVTGLEEDPHTLREEPGECRNLSEVKAVEFYDIPSDTDLHADYTISWLEQQNKNDFYSDKNSNSRLEKSDSITKRSTYSSRFNDFKDYIKNVITFSEELSKQDSSSTIYLSKEKKSKRVNSFLSSGNVESSYAGKYKMKNVLQHNAKYNYKLPKMPNMNKSYQIVFQENMPQGFSLKFVKPLEKEVSTWIVSNRYHYSASKPSFAKTRHYKR